MKAVDRLRRLQKLAVDSKDKFALAAMGYKLVYGKTSPPWRGYPKTRKHTPRLAEKDGKSYYVTRTKNSDGIDAVIAMQDSVPHIARIDQRIGNLVITELISGLNLWELPESNRPKLHEVEDVLGQFVEALDKALIVHADLRPWNVLYSVDKKRFAVIDWGHCYRLPCDYPPCYRHLQACGHAPPFRNIDRYDLERLLGVLREPEKAVDLWKMKKPPTWYPLPWNE